MGTLDAADVLRKARDGEIISTARFAFCAIDVLRIFQRFYGVGDGRAGADVAPLLVVADTERPVDEVTRPCVPVPVDAAGVVEVDPC